MTTTITGTARVEVQITEIQRKTIAVDYLSKAFNVPFGAFLGDGDHRTPVKGAIYHMVAQGGHNNDYEPEVYLKTCTEEQRLVIVLFKAMDMRSNRYGLSS